MAYILAHFDKIKNFVLKLFFKLVFIKLEENKYWISLYKMINLLNHKFIINLSIISYNQGCQFTLSIIYLDRI